MTTDILTLIAGLIALYLGAEALVRGGVGLATKLKIRTIVIGITLVALGTSLPELTIAVASSAKGASAIPIGNVVGSNICNILLILGVAALIRPIPVERKTFREDIPAAIIAAGMLWVVAADGVINRFDGILLLLVYIIFIVQTITKKQEEIVGDTVEKGRRSNVLYAVFILVGLGLLIFGGSATVKGGVALAATFGIPESIVALTLIALGTSLPELATCAVASYKNQSDIAMGNVLGSNICNALLIVGIAALINPFPLEISLLEFSFPIMLLTSVMLIPFIKSGMNLSRLEGAVFLICYVIYIVTLVI